MLNLILNKDDRPSRVFANRIIEKLNQKGIDYREYEIPYGEAMFATSGLWLPLGNVTFNYNDRAKVVEDVSWTSIAQTVSDVINEKGSKVVLLVGRGQTVGKPLTKILLEQSNAQVLVVNSRVDRLDYYKLLSIADTVVFATTGLKEAMDIYRDKIVIDVSYPRAFDSSLPCKELISKRITEDSLSRLTDRISSMEG